MLRTLFGIFVVLHGLVHVWYIVLAQRIVTFQPEMGWSGQSWAFTSLLGDPATRTLASIAYGVATVAFVVCGIGVLAQAGWWRPVFILAAVVSAVGIILFWDGGTSLLVPKGLLGLLLNVALLVALFAYDWPVSAF